jgi:RimJ/RimL family protein N-acetyltransferase
MALLPDDLPAGNLILRRWSAEFAPGVMSAIETSFAELHQWMPWAAMMPTADAMRAVLADGDTAFDADAEWQYVLIEVATNEVVGCAGLHRRARAESLEIGYWVRSDRTARGYATATARALTDAAFTFVPGIERVEIHMDQANRASAAVPPKLGYRLDHDEEFREILTPGHTGKGYVWTINLTAWIA